MKRLAKEIQLKGSFSSLNKEQKGSGIGFLLIVLLIQFKAGWKAL
jgi:hypothetical protein